MSSAARVGKRVTCGNTPACRAFEQASAEVPGFSAGAVRFDSLSATFIGTVTAYEGRKHEY
jgi:hypothetical protein